MCVHMYIDVCIDMCAYICAYVCRHEVRVEISARTSGLLPAHTEAEAHVGGSARSKSDGSTCHTRMHAHSHAYAYARRFASCLPPPHRSSDAGDSLRPFRQPVCRPKQKVVIEGPKYIPNDSVKRET